MRNRTSLKKAGRTISPRTVCLLLTICCFFFTVLNPTPGIAKELSKKFYLRSFYPNVKTIDTNDFLSKYFDSIIIDVRSRFEFDIIHFTKAKHIAISTNVVPALQRIRRQNAETPLIFYCNDSTDTRAFRATQQLLAAGYKNIYTFDTGVFPFLQVDSSKIVLMATTPAQPDLVIPEEDFNNTRIDYQQFRKKSLKRSTLVIDIRRTALRQFIPQLKGIKNIPLESLLDVIKNRIWSEKKLLFFDQNGAQTAWLQYFLQASGYTNYYFLRGGVSNLNREQIRQIHSRGNKISINQEKIKELSLDNTFHEIDIRLINILLGSITTENHASIEFEHLTTVLQCTPELVIQSIKRLSNKGTLHFGLIENMLICELNPKLAWKGKMTGTLWRSRIREFEASEIKTQ